ncbi:MAG: elongation factor P [Candidatus Marinimicrobia bacterium]|nr:elongation factor P [Candidatus Neomarinimicrobiota bacterium]
MATTADIRNGAVMLFKDKRMRVVDFQHVKPGKGGAFVRTKLKDIQSGKLIDHTFNAGARVEFIRVEAKMMQYLYEDGDQSVFMDNETFDQLNVSLGEEKQFLKAGMNADLLFDGDEVIDVRLPAHVQMEVTATEPGMKGNTATGATKPATLETGYTVNVPLFIDEGDILKIDTRTGEYLERVSKA